MLRPVNLIVMYVDTDIYIHGDGWTELNAFMVGTHFTCNSYWGYFSVFTQNN